VARWSQANGLAAPLLLTATPSATYALRLAGGNLMLHAGSLVARWNGLELHLGFAPKVIDGQLFLHGLDLQKTVQPLLRPLPEWPGDRDPVLVIDPGHGGADAGAKSAVENRYEKEFTLDWALRLRTLLASNHWQVYLTRTTDIEVPLSYRVAFAEKRKADVFLSLHFNSAGSDQVEGGLETYCLTPVGMPSSLTRGFADETAAAFPNNAFDEQNLQIALRIHRALLQVNGHYDRGVRRARFPTVLRGQQRPAVLIEGGYLSSPREARLIGDPNYRQKLAEAVAHALTGDTDELARHSDHPDT
jgi:N-acetylmuramoyl-L-alanine amidase